MKHTSLSQLRSEATASLVKAGIDSAALDADVLLAHVLGRDRAYLLSHGNDALAPAIVRRFLKVLHRRMNHEPVAYITGVKEFYGWEFAVNRHVLIPRPKTEEMVEEAKRVLRAWGENDKFQMTNDKSHTLVIDVGTGSGILAITVKKLFPRVNVLAIDHSKRALRVAKGNAERHGMHAIGYRLSAFNFQQSEIHFLYSDLLSKVREVPFYNILILANLPYVPTREIATLERDVKDYEPGKALDGGGDGLDLFHRLARQIRKKFPDKQVKVLWECEEGQEAEVGGMFTSFTA